MSGSFSPSRLKRSVTENAGVCFCYQVFNIPLPPKPRRRGFTGISDSHPRPVVTGDTHYVHYKYVEGSELHANQWHERNLPEINFRKIISKRCRGKNLPELFSYLPTKANYSTFHCTNLLTVEILIINARCSEIGYSGIYLSLANANTARMQN